MGKCVAHHLRHSWLALVLLALFAAVPSRVGAQYALVVGSSGSSRVDLLNLDWNGNLTPRSSFDLWDDTLYFGDPGDLVVSSQGNYVFLYDWNYFNGALYSVDSSCDFHFIREMTDGCSGCGYYACGGGGFTTDEKYLFTSDPVVLPATHAFLMTWRLDGQTCDLRTSQTVPTANTLTGNFLTNSLDEVMGSSLNGTIGSPDGFSVYEFDRGLERLSLKQYIPGVPCVYSAMSPTEDFVAHTWTQVVGTIVRDSQGTYTLQSSYWDPAWGYHNGCGVCITPDSTLAVSTVSSVQGPSGPALFSVTTQRNLVFRQFVQKDYTGPIAMTPDGRFVVVAHAEQHVGYNISLLTVFRINYSVPSLEEVSTTSIVPQGSCMKFLPQALATPPTKAEPTWPLYSSKSEAKPHSVAPDTANPTHGTPTMSATPPIRLASRAR